MKSLEIEEIKERLMKNIKERLMKNIDLPHQNIDYSNITEYLNFSKNKYADNYNKEKYSSPIQKNSNNKLFDFSKKQVYILIIAFLFGASKDYILSSISIFGSVLSTRIKNNNEELNKTRDKLDKNLERYFNISFDYEHELIRREEDCKKNDLKDLKLAANDSKKLRDELKKATAIFQLYLKDPIYKEMKFNHISTEKFQPQFESCANEVGQALDSYKWYQHRIYAYNVVAQAIKKEDFKP